MFSKKIIADFKKRITPFYYYDTTLLRHTLSQLKTASEKYDFHIHYALKANYNDCLLDIIKNAELGADCVSGYEVEKAIEIGFSPQKVVFAGVGKTDNEIKLAIKAHIFAFNVESLQELEVIDQMATELKEVVQIALRINPNVDAKTHKYITTGLGENKFGISIDNLEKCIDLLKKSKHSQFLGLHFHVGSQILNMKVFEQLCYKANDFVENFEQNGLPVKVINVGGGLGINYDDPESQLIPDFEQYFSIFNQYLKRRTDQEVHFELGRSIVGQCGFLISKVLYLKNGSIKNFLILDAGMTELMRPALYQAIHQIKKLEYNDDEPKESYDVVGPICESADVFRENITFPKSDRGDLMVIYSSGAYGAVMSSNYNLRPTVESVFDEDISIV